MTREAYAQQLQELQDLVVQMGSLVDVAIDRSVDALRRQDVLLAQEVCRADGEINRLRWDAEDLALLIIATQAPMAGDLRRVAAVIHIATELERMADHAAGNAKIVLATASEPLLKPLVDLPKMSLVSREMLAQSIDAFVRSDAQAARRIVLRDDEVDALYNQIYHELLRFMIADPSTINRATHLLWAAHNLERIGDRVTNICERVVFAATGSMEQLEVATS